MHAPPAAQPARVSSVLTAAASCPAPSTRPTTGDSLVIVTSGLTTSHGRPGALHYEVQVPRSDARDAVTSVAVALPRGLSRARGRAGTRVSATDLSGDRVPVRLCGSRTTATVVLLRPVPSVQITIPGSALVASRAVTRRYARLVFRVVARSRHGRRTVITVTSRYASRTQ